MPSFHPRQGRPFRDNRPARPWEARRKRDGIDQSLGFYATRAEAVARELAFDVAIPSRRGTTRVGEFLIERRQVVSWPYSDNEGDPAA